jgi:lysophospholipase L1-like esterase
MARLVVVGDSLAFHGPEGPVPVGDPRLYPNRAAVRLGLLTGVEWSVQLVARAGWSLREAWLAVAKDVHLRQQLLPDADAVVLAVGTTDCLPVGIPRALMAGLPYLRPSGVRRRVRRGLHRAHPWLVRATRARMRWTPAAVCQRCWRETAWALRALAPGAALCATLPALHAHPYFGRSLRHQPALAAELRDLADELDIPWVDVAGLMAPWMDQLNPDGMHWPFELHAAVGAELAAALAPELAYLRSS